MLEISGWFLFFSHSVIRCRICQLSVLSSDQQLKGFEFHYLWESNNHRVFISSLSPSLSLKHTHTHTVWAMHLLTFDAYLFSSSLLYHTKLTLKLFYIGETPWDTRECSLLYVPSWTNCFGYIPNLLLFSVSLDVSCLFISSLSFHVHMIARLHDKQISPHLIFAYFKAISAGVVYLGY